MAKYQIRNTKHINMSNCDNKKFWFKTIIRLYISYWLQLAGVRQDKVEEGWAASADKRSFVCFYNESDANKWKEEQDQVNCENPHWEIFISEKYSPLKNIHSW